MPRGILAAAATPRRAGEYSIDLGATLELVDFLGESRAAGIVLLGGTGEFIHFALDDRRHMFNFAAKRSRVPLFVNVSYSTVDGAVELGREAAHAGAAGLLLMPPYYFLYSQETIFNFYISFATAMGGRVPVYLSNAPVFSTGLAASTAAQLLATGLFTGIAESSAELEDFRLFAEHAKRRSLCVFGGYERIYVRARSLGADGIISGIASALPELMVALDESLEREATERIARLEARVVEFLDWSEQLPHPVGIKEAAKERKLKMGAVAVPLGEQDARKLEEFREWFRGWLPGVLRECRL